MTTLDDAPRVVADPRSSASPGPRALVVGAGFGGLAAALRLRARGYEVEVVDRCERAGGRAQVFEREGFTFDAGPTVVTAPFLFEELYELHGRRLADYVDMRPVEPWYRFQFHDGKTFDYGGTVEQTLEEIRRFEPRDVDGYRRLLDASKEIFEVGFRKLGDQPFGDWASMLRCLPDLIRLGSHRSVYGLVAKHLRSPYLRQAFSIQPLLVGGNPFDTTSVYSLIHYLEREWGIHFPMGGTGALVDGLVRLAEDVGIRFRLGTSVARIRSHAGRATGIDLESGERLDSDIVVSNADAPHLYKEMVDTPKRRWTDRKLARMRYSMGLFVLYFGTDRKYDDVQHHTIWMGRRYKQLLKDIFHRQVLAEDFSLYLHRPTATDPSMAPAGGDSFYVLAPVPNLQAGIDWSSEGPHYARRILESLEQTLLPGLRDHLQVQFHMTPADFKDRYLSAHGAGFSIQPLLTQSAWFRFHNRSEELDGLYLVGAGTHPGAGLPGVLSSAKVLDRVVPDPVRR